MNVKDIESLSSLLKQWDNFNSGVLFLTKMICTSNDWPYGEIWHPDANNEFMVWTGLCSRNDDYFEKFSKFSSLHKFAKGIGLIGKTWEQKKLLWLENVSVEGNFLRSSLAPVKGLNSAISFPILKNEDVICVLCFFLNKISLTDKQNAEFFFTHSGMIGEILVNLSL